MNIKDDIKTKWQGTRATKKSKGSLIGTLPLLVVFLIIILAFMYILSRYK